MVCECDGKGCEGKGMKYNADWMLCKCDRMVEGDGIVCEGDGMV